MSAFDIWQEKNGLKSVLLKNTKTGELYVAKKDYYYKNKDTELKEYEFLYEL